MAWGRDRAGRADRVLGVERWGVAWREVVKSTTNKKGIPRSAMLKANTMRDWYVRSSLKRM